MLKLAPEQLNSASQSSYRAALEQSYRWLRFAPALERRFRDSYTEVHLLRVRMAGMLPIAGRSAAELMAVADAALFQAKEQGRDRVVALILTGESAASPGSKQ